MNKKHTKESLESFTSSELIELVLVLQEDQTKLSSNITPDTLLTWLKSRSRGNFVTATKKDIMEQFNCTASAYTKSMRYLYSNGFLGENKYQGKRIQSSHILIK